MGRTIYLRIVGALATAACAVFNSPTRGDFKELLGKLPRGANTLVMLNAEQIFASEIATKDGWKQNYGATYADTPLLLPPSAQHFVLAADMDLATMHPRWQAAVMRLANDPSMGLIARTIHGQMDTIGDMEAISTPRGALIVKFGPRVFGVMQPGGRQPVARWVRDANSGQAAELSPYLQAAANVPDRVGTEIIMAIDMADALSRDRIRQGVEKSKVLGEASVNLDAAADELASLQGATLGARVTRRVYGELRIDFGRDIVALKEVAKPLLLEVLGEAGAEIDEFHDWKVEVSQRRIALSGELTQSGMRRLFSFLELDATAVGDTKPEQQAGASTPAAASDDAMAPAVDAYKSRDYFQAITRHLNDLKHERGAHSYYTIAVWFDKYARRIDRLPILGVDKDLVDYGQKVVGQLRNCVEAIRGAGISSGARSAQVTSAGYGYDGDGYAPYALFAGSATYAQYAKAEVGAVEAQRRAIRAEEQGQSSMDVRAMVRQLQEETSLIRRQMTERYGIEFGERPPRRPASNN
jgi:hypothetical protein